MITLTKPKSFVAHTVCIAVVIVLCSVLLRAYFDPDVFHSSSLDQQFHMPPLLHAARLAWLGDGSFFFNYLTAEPMWGAAHFSPYYPLYGPLAIFFYDGLGVQDYVVIGDYISLIHRMIFAVGCYYLARMFSENYMIAIFFAVFVATAEAVRIPSNWYIAMCAYAWVPFMLGGAIDIYKKHLVRGLVVLIPSTILSVYAAPIYLGLGVALIPLTLILLGFVYSLFFQNSYPKCENTAEKTKVMCLLVMSAFGLLLIISPIMLSTILGMGDYIRWTRSGPVTGRDILNVGSELFFETKDWGYLKRLVIDHGIRGVYSSYFLGTIVTFLYFSSPIIWLFSRKNKSKNWLNVRLIIWSIALLHLTFIFGKKLIIPTIMEYIPLVNSFRHLSAFGTIFIILASLCAFDTLRIILKCAIGGQIKPFVSMKFTRVTFFLTAIYLSFLWAIIMWFSDIKIMFLCISIGVFILFVLATKHTRKFNPSWVSALSIVIILSMAISEQQQSRFNKPAKGKQYAAQISQINDLMSGISPKGELINAVLSLEYSKANRVSYQGVESHLSTLNFRVVLAYLSPRRHARFRAGISTSIGSAENKIQSGVTLLLVDRGAIASTEYLSDLNQKAELINKTDDFLLYRLAENASTRANFICIDKNICGLVRDGYVHLNIFPYKEFQFRDKNNGNAIIEKTNSEISTMLTKLPYNPNMKLKAYYRPGNSFFIILLAFIGILITATAITLIRKQENSKNSRSSEGLHDNLAPVTRL